MNDYFGNPEFDVSEEVEALSVEQYVIAMQRALKRFGVDYEIQPDGQMAVAADLEDLEEDDEFTEIFADELKRLVAQDILDDLKEEGEIEVTRVDDEGNL